MLEKLVRRYVPAGLVPRRQRLHLLVKAVIERQAGMDFDRWCAKCNLSDREVKTYCDFIDEKLCDGLGSYDPELVVKDVVFGLLEYVTKHCPLLSDDEQKQFAERCGISS
jgi:hypothetical protein